MKSFINVLVLAFTGALLGLTGPSHAAGFDQAFQQRSLPDLMRSLDAAQATASKDIALRAPDVAEVGNAVPIQITSRIPGTEWIALIVDKNPTPLAALSLTVGEQPRVEARLRMVDSSEVRALIKAQGRYYVSSKFVKVAIGGCGGGATAAATQTNIQTLGATKVRGVVRDGIPIAQVLIQHPMETGLRQTEDGRMVTARDPRTLATIAPHYIRQVRGHLNGKLILHAYWGPSISAVPFLSFALPNAKPGDRISIDWEDNRGLRGTGSAPLS